MRRKETCRTRGSRWESRSWWRLTCEDFAARCSIADLLEEELLDEVEVGFGVDADGVVVGGLDVEVEAVFEEAELFESLGALELAGGQRGEEIERGLAIGVEADVLPVRRGSAVAVVGDGGAGEIEGAAIGGGDDFDRVWVGDVLGGAADFQRGHVDVCVRERAKQGGDVFGAEERFVTLDVDIDVGVVELGDGVDAVGSAGKIGRGEFHGDVETMAEAGDLFGVSGNQDAVELGTRARCIDDPGEQGTARYLAENLAGEAGGGEAGGDDTEDA
jgi:hypothetical protein